MEDAMNPRSLPFAIMLSTMLMGGGSSYAWDEHEEEDTTSSDVRQGFDISPIPEAKLALTGKEPETVDKGSYLVNAAADCSACHSFPQFLPKGDTAGSDPAADDPS
jgi:hypothetical protein